MIDAVGLESEGNQAARSNCSSSHRCHRSAHRGSTWFLLSRCKDKHYFVNFQIFEPFSSIFHHLSNNIHTQPNAPFHKIIKILWNYFCVFNAIGTDTDIPQYDEVKFVQMPHKNHDRFLIIDDSVYLLGASVKDMGNGLCAVTKLTATPETVLELLK